MKGCKKKQRKLYFMHPKFKGKKVFYLCGARDKVLGPILCPSCKRAIEEDLIKEDLKEELYN